MSDREYTRLLKQHDWATLYKEAVVRAGFKIHKYEWNELAPDPRDIANEAVTLIFRGEKGHRRWEPKKKDLRDHLLGVVDSLVWAAVINKSNAKRSELPVSADDGEAEMDLDEMSFGPKHGQVTSAIEETIESEEEADALSDKVLEAFGGDKTLEAVFDMLMDGRKPEEIAQRLELTNKDVYKLERRIEMKLRPLFPESQEPRRSSRRPKED